MHLTSCNKAAEICDKAQYHEATWWELFRMKLHHRFCQLCAKHSKQNTALTQLCQKANLHSLSEEDKSAMKNRLENEG